MQSRFGKGVGAGYAAALFALAAPVQRAPPADPATQGLPHSQPCSSCPSHQRNRLGRMPPPPAHLPLPPSPCSPHETLSIQLGEHLGAQLGRVSDGGAKVHNKLVHCAQPSRRLLHIKLSRHGINGSRGGTFSDAVHAACHAVRPALGFGISADPAFRLIPLPWHASGT